MYSHSSFLNVFIFGGPKIKRIRIRRDIDISQKSEMYLLIILFFFLQETLANYDRMLYFDSSVRFLKNGTEHLRPQIQNTGQSGSIHFYTQILQTKSCEMLTWLLPMRQEGWSLRVKICPKARSPKVTRPPSKYLHNSLTIFHLICEKLIMGRFGLLVTIPLLGLW